MRGDFKGINRMCVSTGVMVNIVEQHKQKMLNAKLKERNCKNSTLGFVKMKRSFFPLYILLQRLC